MSGTIFDNKNEFNKELKTSHCLDSEKKVIEKRSKIVGKLLTQYRLKHGYTQQAISDIVGVAQQTYAGYESGRHEPSIEILIRLANVYGVSLDLLTGRYVISEKTYTINNVESETIDQQEQPTRKKYNRVKKENILKKTFDIGRKHGYQATDEMLNELKKRKKSKQDKEN